MDMKKLTSILLAGILVSLSAQAVEVATPIITSKKWVANTITGHTAWNTDACVASTLSTTTADSILEIYSEKTGELYAEPTIQVVFKEAKQVYSADVITDKGAKWTFTLASAPVDPELQSVMARLKDREAIIKALKSDSAFTVKLKDVKGKAIKSMQYSLSGSSKAIDEQFKACSLKFEVVP